MKTSADMLPRLEALVRRMAKEWSEAECTAPIKMLQSYREARAVVSELPEPVDPDEVEAERLVAAWMETNESRLDLARTAIRRGRELERGQP